MKNKLASLALLKPCILPHQDWPRAQLLGVPC